MISWNVAYFHPLIAQLYCIIAVIDRPKVQLELRAGLCSGTEPNLAGVAKVHAYLGISILARLKERR